MKGRHMAQFLRMEKRNFKAKKVGVTGLIQYECLPLRHASIFPLLKPTKIKICLTVFTVLNLMTLRFEQGAIPLRAHYERSLVENWGDRTE